MRRAFLVGLVACGGARAPAPPVPHPSDAHAGSGVAVGASEARIAATEVTGRCRAADYTRVPDSATIYGVACDERDGTPLAGVTVIATSPALADTQTAMTDERGVYAFGNLPPGNYLVTFYYADCTIETSTQIADHAREVVESIPDPDHGCGEVIHR